MSATFLHGGGDNPEARSIAFGRFAQAYLTNVQARPLLIVATAHEEAEARGFPFPYLYDESQQVARAYGAVSVSYTHLDVYKRQP